MNKVIFACDIGGSKLLCGFVTEQGDIVDTERCPLSPDMTTEQLELHILDAYTALCARNASCTSTACGITIPGLADRKQGLWVYACFSGIAEYPIAARLGERLGLPITVENDVNACAWAEKVYGCCRDCDDFLWVTVSNGVGGGLILNGKLYEGAFGGAGECGHIVVQEDGDRCPCGHSGCMEAVAAGPAISRRYERLTGECLSAAQIADRARAGERTALQVMQKTGEYIGRGLGKAASLLNLERYVLGGGVMQSFDLLIPHIRAAFDEQAFARPNAKVEILPTALGYEAGLLGAAAITR